MIWLRPTSAPRHPEDAHVDPEPTVVARRRTWFWRLVSWWERVTDRGG